MRKKTFVAVAAVLIFAGSLSPAFAWWGNPGPNRETKPAISYFGQAGREETLSWREIYWGELKFLEPRFQQIERTFERARAAASPEFAEVWARHAMEQINDVIKRLEEEKRPIVFEPSRPGEPGRDLGEISGEVGDKLRHNKALDENIRRFWKSLIVLAAALQQAEQARLERA